MSLSKVLFHTKSQQKGAKNLASLLIVRSYHTGTDEDFDRRHGCTSGTPDRRFSFWHYDSVSRITEKAPHRGLKIRPFLCRLFYKIASLQCIDT